tara:strand:+ start:583 stop:798 length:216 start_codon:yes stop_codon:yes gene_type:complete
MPSHGSKAMAAQTHHPPQGARLMIAAIVNLIASLFVVDQIVNVEAQQVPVRRYSGNAHQRRIARRADARNA